MNRRPIVNNKEEAPRSYYLEKFRALDPAAVVTRLPFVRWEGNAFHLTLLGQNYVVTWPEGAICPDGAAALRTLLLRLLLEGQDIPDSGKWKTFRELPWGEVYQQTYEGRIRKRAAFAFGTRLEAFRAASGKLGAVPVSDGDAGFEFVFFGPYRMRILVWEGDEEFPPAAQVLYSDNFALGFSAEDRVVAAEILISRIKRAM